MVRSSLPERESIRLDSDIQWMQKALVQMNLQLPLVHLAF